MGIRRGSVLRGVSDDFIGCIGDARLVVDEGGICGSGDASRESPRFAAGKGLRADIGK